MQVFLGLVLIVLRFIEAETAPCPPPDNASWGTCASATQTITIDWTNYASVPTCREVEIVLPENYGADTCTWRIEIVNIPGGLSPGITVNAAPDGAATAADLIAVRSERSGGALQLEFNDNLDNLYANEWASVSPSASGNGEADAVEITVTSVGGFTGAGFTLRVAMYTIDQASCCGTATAPLNIDLTTDYPTVALATPNFPSQFIEALSCYTFVNSPADTVIRVDYLTFDLRRNEEYLLIFDATDPANPSLLRLQNAPQFNADGLATASFESRTNKLHVSFQERGTRENPGILLLFTAVPDPPMMQTCDPCSCPGPTATTLPSCEVTAGAGFLPFVPNTPDDTMCMTPPITNIDLDFTDETVSSVFLATPNFNSGGYLVSDATCRWVVAGPAGSHLVLTFRSFVLSDGDHISLRAAGVFGEFFRLEGSGGTTFGYSDGTSLNSYSVIGEEIRLPWERIQIFFTLTSGIPAVGASFEVRAVDNRCDPGCINGGSCSCTCLSGFFGQRCDRVITISLSLVTPTTITEGASNIEIECVSERLFSDGAELAFQVDTSASTALEGSLYDIQTIAPYKCVFPTNRRTVTVTVPVIDDIFVEDDEVIALMKGPVTGGAQPTAADDAPDIPIITIVDNGDTIKIQAEFDSALYEVEENVVGGMLTGNIAFNYQGVPYPIPEDGEITLSYTAATATSPEDYTEVTSIPFSKTSFPVTTSVPFMIPIIDDPDEEDLEMFFVTLALTTPTLVEVGTRSMATIRIRDNDRAENIIIIDSPQLAKQYRYDLNIFSYSYQDHSIRYRKEDSEKPKTDDSSLMLNGSPHGRTFSFPLTNRLPSRRLGHYKFFFGSGTASSIDGFVRSNSECLFSNEGSTITVYPSPTDNTILSSPLSFGLSSIGECPTNFKWEKDGQDLDNSRDTQTVSTREEADGVFTITRRGREELGWFAMFKVTVSDCPLGKYMVGAACTGDCPNCQNGGVCELDGTCRCPPCFTGPTCQIKSAGDGTRFDPSRRFLCSDLPTLRPREDCEELYFCYGGLYGCSCGCGWQGSNCDKECDDGYYGADCEQKCSCDVSSCDRFTGCP